MVRLYPKLSTVLALALEVAMFFGPRTAFCGLETGVRDGTDRELERRIPLAEVRVQ
jgi:hypothetical protein